MNRVRRRTQTGSRRVTLQTIADAMSVSRATVSNAYNHPERLNPELRKLIMAKAKEFGYGGPDPAARHFRLRHTGTVGLLYTEPLSYAFADPAVVVFIREVARACESAGVGLLLLPSPPHADAARTMRGAVVDALCVWSIPEYHPALEALQARELPTVLVDEPRLDDVAFVGIDDHAGGRMIGSHLAGLGHRRIAVLTPRLLPDDYTGWVDPDRLGKIVYTVFRDRLDGLRATLAEAGVAWAGVAIQERRNTPADGAAGTVELLALGPRAPTAIVALSDQLALGALRGIRGAGLRVPEDVSVTGFDDIAEASAAVPALTTVRQPLAEKGRLVGSLLLDLARGAEARQEVFDVELIIRASTAAPPQR